ncbi:hypothetical protein M918_18875 [Clostridium sp. BL8]|nr:hypothetical protein M918_18875 [Clostridium sp. BL8]
MLDSFLLALLTLGKEVKRMSEILEMALRYSEVGITVMPLHGIKEDGSCTCRNGSNCASKSKHPMFNV